MAAKTFTGFHIDPQDRDRIERLASQRGVSISELLRQGAAHIADEAGVEATGLPASGYRWNAKDFFRFAEGLSLPEGAPFEIEGHIRLIIREVFVKDRVELLVLLPKGNYKTTLFAALAVFHALTVPNANCFVGAADTIQAGEMYRFASHFAETHPDAKPRLIVRRSTKEIRVAADQGFIRVLASDDSRTGGKKQGFNPTLALVDELHAHENANLYSDMRSGLFKRNGVLVTITTAGQDEDTVLGRLRSEFIQKAELAKTLQRGLQVSNVGRTRKNKKGRLTIARTGRNVMLEWACTDDDDLDDPKTVKLANPASGVTIASLEDFRDAPGLTPQQFARYRANVWAQPDDAVIGEAEYDACNDGSTIPEGAPRWVIVDYARKSDSTACVQLYYDEERDRLIPKAHVWARRIKDAGRPQPAAHELIEGETIIRQSIVRQHIRDIEGEVLGVIYDPHLFDPEELSDEGYLMVEFPQTPSRTVPASKQLYEVINERRFAHDGDPVLRSHVTSAGSKDAGEGWRFSKAASKKKIDACMCLVMGVEQALEGGANVSFTWV